MYQCHYQLCIADFMPHCITHARALASWRQKVLLKDASVLLNLRFFYSSTKHPGDCKGTYCVILKQLLLTPRIAIKKPHFSREVKDSYISGPHFMAP